MKTETKYPEKVQYNGTLHGIENPIFELREYNSPHYVSDHPTESTVIEAEIVATHPLFTPITPKPKTHEIKILIDGQESRPFREIEEPGKIIIQSGSGSVATIDIGSGDEVDQVVGGETNEGEGYTDEDMLNWWHFAFDKWDSFAPIIQREDSEHPRDWFKAWKESRK